MRGSSYDKQDSDMLFEAYKNLDEEQEDNRQRNNPHYMLTADADPQQDESSDCKHQWHEWQGLCHYMITDGVTVGRDEQDTSTGQNMGSQHFGGLPKMPSELEEGETISLASVTGPKFTYVHAAPEEGTPCGEYAQSMMNDVNQMRNDYNEHS
tara:strand:- start:68 stop:526 length:459 start_codon:yes stop_codon:yes gene_type:complete